MIHKIRYFESKELAQGVYLQDVVNDFLAEKGDNVIAVLPVMDNTLLVHYKEWSLFFYWDECKTPPTYITRIIIFIVVQLQISNETMKRMEKIAGISHARDGDFLVNELIDVLEKKIREKY